VRVCCTAAIMSAFNRGSAHMMLLACARRSTQTKGASIEGTCSRMPPLFVSLYLSELFAALFASLVWKH
jgi:hypothetical protein